MGREVLWDMNQCILVLSYFPKRLENAGNLIWVGKRKKKEKEWKKKEEKKNKTLPFCRQRTFIESICIHKGTGMTECDSSERAPRCS